MKTFLAILLLVAGCGGNPGSIAGVREKCNDPNDPEAAVAATDLLISLLQAARQDGISKLEAFALLEGCSDGTLSQEDQLECLVCFQTIIDFVYP